MKNFKSIILATITILSCIHTAEAQWVAGSPPNLYTTTNNVGIGTSTPAQRFSVSGEISS